MPKKQVIVITTDLYLFQAIRLDAGDEYEVHRVCGDAALPPADTVLCDVRACTSVPPGAWALVPDAETCADIPANARRVPLPLPWGAIRRLLLQEKSGALTLCEKDRTVRLCGRTVRLTEVEFSLLRVLATARTPLSRDELAQAVWGVHANNSLLNVYIHYLRAKLESDGERIILSARGAGYRLNEKYKGGASEC